MSTEWLLTFCHGRNTIVGSNSNSMSWFHRDFLGRNLSVSYAMILRGWLWESALGLVVGEGNV